MKVLFVSNDPALFDPQSAVRARMRTYASEIGELHILSRGPRTEEVHEGALHLYGLRANKLCALPLMAKEARAIVANNDIEIVSAQDPFEYGWVAYRAVRGTHAKLHVQVHTDFLSPWFRSPLGVSSLSMRMLNMIRVRLADRILPRASGVRTVSSRIRESIIARYSSSVPSPTVVPLPVSMPEGEALPLPSAPFTYKLIAVGRLESEKRFQDILYALQRVCAEYPDTGLYIVGRGRREASLKKLAHALGLSEKVQFLGHHSQVSSLMRSADAFVQVSAYEGYGLTLIEAALARIPIVTTDVGVVGDVLLPETDVRVVGVGNVEDLAQSLIGLRRDAEPRTQMVESAHAHAYAHATQANAGPKAVARDLVQLLP